MPRVGDQGDESAVLGALMRDAVEASRSEAVRRGLKNLIERHAVGARIVAGYLAQPQTDDELTWARQGAERVIAAEPW